MSQSDDDRKRLESIVGAGVPKWEMDDLLELLTRIRLEAKREALNQAASYLERGTALTGRQACAAAIRALK